MAVRFDAAADRLLRTTDLPDYNSTWTVMTWFNSAVTPAFLNYGTIFRVGTDSATVYDALEYGWDDQLRLSCEGGSGGAGSVNIGAVTTNTWYHGALVRASATDLRGYLNGVVGTTVTTSISTRAAASRMEAGGARSANASPLDGRLAGVKVWTTNLSAAEVQQEMRQLLPVRTANLHGFWPLLTIGDDEIDFSGNARDWTVGGTLATEGAPPIPWRVGHHRTVYIPAAAASVKNIGGLALTGVGA